MKKGDTWIIDDAMYFGDYGRKIFKLSLSSFITEIVDDRPTGVRIG